ncbi:MAG: alpha/beta fold hydrolase [Acidobacteria bacterium]|nr:alpha/beta fold hydrolase [Acidobacteriota bacterium]
MPSMTVRDIDIHYEIYGDGAPLVLIGGLGLDVASWGPQVTALARRFRVVVFDNRGVGRSDATEPPYSTAVMAEDTAALLDGLGIGRAHVLGVSMGGLIAQELALHRPDSVEGLILAATAGRIAPRGRHAIDSWRRLVLEGVDRETILRDQLPWVFSDRFLGNPDQVSGFVATVLSNPHPQPAEGFVGQAMACLRHDALARAAGIRARTLVVAGGDDILIPARSSAELADAIPGARLLVFDEAPHAFPMESPDRFNEAVLYFLGATTG